MLKIKYKIEETHTNIFTIVVPNNYDRAMLFCKVQEFYESPNIKFVKKRFSFWDYHRWYSLKNNNSFTYPKDWSGFNFPTKVAIECYKKNKLETPYDLLMKKILTKIKNKNSYLIGVKSTNTPTHRHELCHGFFYTNLDYKKEMLSLNKKLSKKHYQKLKLNLLNVGYNASVVDDEIQAYLATGGDLILRGINNKNICKEYKTVFKNYE